MKPLAWARLYLLPYGTACWPFNSLKGSWHWPNTISSVWEGQKPCPITQPLSSIGPMLLWPPISQRSLLCLSQSTCTFCAGVHSCLLWLTPGLHRLLLSLASGRPWTHSVYWVHVGWRNPWSVLAFFSITLTWATGLNFSNIVIYSPFSNCAESMLGIL